MTDADPLLTENRRLKEVCRELRAERDALRDVIRRARVAFCEDGLSNEQAAAKMFVLLTARGTPADAALDDGREMR